ncbi:MAG: YlbF family regulator [Bacilli bacterium]
MTDTVKNLTLQLQQALMQEPSFIALKQSLMLVSQDPQGARLLQGFLELQKQLQQKMQQGVAVTEQEQQLSNQYIMQMQNYPVTADFLQKEMQFAAVVNEINEMLSAPLTALFQ